MHSQYLAQGGVPREEGYMQPGTACVYGGCGELEVGGAIYAHKDGASTKGAKDVNGLK